MYCLCDSSEHRAPRATRLHQIREVSAAQQLIWENDLSELYSLGCRNEGYNHAFCSRVSELGFGLPFPAFMDGAGLISVTSALGRNGID